MYTFLPDEKSKILSEETLAGLLLVISGDSDEVDQHSAVMPISVPGWSNQSSERSDAGFCILLKVIAIVKLVAVEAV
jgi:hypothetical protein